tara:strand:- start:7170 stop:7550 length:381 start_codon:yes stop_codon:yes gene_type:complete
MAVITYKELYDLVKNNICCFEYYKSDVRFNVTCTLAAEHIDDDARNPEGGLFVDAVIETNALIDTVLTGVGNGDSDANDWLGSLLTTKTIESNPPEFLVVYNVINKLFVPLYIDRIQKVISTNVIV